MWWSLSQLCPGQKKYKSLKIQAGISLQPTPDTTGRNSLVLLCLFLGGMPALPPVLQLLTHKIWWGKNNTLMTVSQSQGLFLHVFNRAFHRSVSVKENSCSKLECDTCVFSLQTLCLWTSSSDRLQTGSSYEFRIFP